MNYGLLTATIALFVGFCHAKPFESGDFIYMIKRGISALRQATVFFAIHLFTLDKDISPAGPTPLHHLLRLLQKQYRLS